MAHALYAWTFHFDGVKRLCKLPDKRHCVGGTPTLPSIIAAILKYEKKEFDAAIKRGAQGIEEITAEDIYPVDMHFMMTKRLQNAVNSCQPECDWFRNNLHKVRAAYGIDADESDTYLVVEE